MNAAKRIPSIGKLSSEVLISKSGLNGTEKVRAQRLVSEVVRSVTRSQTVIDNWIHNAMRDKNYGHQKQVAVLHLPVVLKTLQRLRSTDKRASYFALVSKIKSSQIRWISQSEKVIDTRGDLPAEFYNEVSNMLYRLSLKCDLGQLEALSKFLLSLLASHESALEQRNSLKRNIKFYRNCLLPITRTESAALLYEGLKIIPSSLTPLKLLIELAFYFQTSQFTKLSAHLEQHFLGHDSVTLQKEEIDAFFPLFFSIMHKCIILGDEKTCKKILRKMTEDWNVELDDHHKSLLIEVCERNGAHEVFPALHNVNYFLSSPELRWKAIQYQSTWAELMSYMCDIDVNLFDEAQDLDFLQQKLSTVGPAFKDWKSFLDDNKVPEAANSSLKALAINTVLVNLVARKNIDFVMSILEHMIYDMNYCQQFLDTARLYGQTRYSGFHCLFKAFSRSPSAILTSSTLLSFLERKHDFLFNFTTNDYYFMMKSCLTGADHHSIYYFLFRYIWRNGSSLFRRTGDDLTWSLPPRIQQLLKHSVAEERGDVRVLEIIEKVRDWFLKEQPSSHDKISESSLKHLFGDEFVSEITIRSLVALEKRYPMQEISGRSHKWQYSPSVDLDLSRRLHDLLCFVEHHLSKNKALQS